MFGPTHSFKEHSTYFVAVAVLFVAILMISNTVAAKLVQIGPFIVSGGIVVFPISYIFGDILTEVYGYGPTRKIIWLGFIAMILMSLLYYVVGLMPFPPFWTSQEAYMSILGIVPRIVLGSVLGYFLGEFANSYILSRMKVWSKGKHLWMRTIGSTIVGEAVDTLVFVLVAFGGILGGEQLMTVMLSGYVLKVTIEVVLTPLTYFIVHQLKKIEGVDAYDTEISYNPFAV